jgi:pyruvate/2-oxoglutarate dehydrogenase complex dihydrolipoamide dehydrogenase (E3) component
MKWAMSISNFYSLVVIGAGAGGLVVAIGFAKAGKKVLLIENGNYGGDCTNFGCIPSKTLIGLAKHQKKDLSFVRQIVHEVRAHEEPVSLNKLGVETLTAQASFLEPHVIFAKEKSGKTVQVLAKKIVIATGSSPQIPPIPGLNDTPFLTNESIFNLEQIPKSLIVLGGGPIGSELAQAFQRLGTAVHLIHSHSEILARESKEASDILIEQFRKEGMVLHLNSKVERVEYKSASFKVVLSGKTVEAERLLVATGSALPPKNWTVE